MEKLTIPELKTVCKLKNIKGYSKWKKDEYIKNIKTLMSIQKIQRFYRNRHIKNETCPISLEPITYPYFSFKTKSNKILYYNVSSIKEYLITTGNFKDPQTREKITPKHLKIIDDLDPDKTNSVVKASRNIARYRRERYREEDIQGYIRLIDEIGAKLIRGLEHNNSKAYFRDYLYEFRYRYRPLYNISQNDAHYQIDKCITNINHVVDRMDFTNTLNEKRDYVILNLIVLKEHGTLAL